MLCYIESFVIDVKKGDKIVFCREICNFLDRTIRGFRFLLIFLNENFSQANVFRSLQAQDELL